MQLKNGLALFERTNSKGRWNIASFHSPHSLTWRWLFAFSNEIGKWRVRPLWYGYRTNVGPHGGFRVPFIGEFSWQTQEPMWYRDIYRSLYEKTEIAEKRMWPGPTYEEPPMPRPLMPENRSVH